MSCILKIRHEKQELIYVLLAHHPTALWVNCPTRGQRSHIQTFTATSGPADNVQCDKYKRNVIAWLDVLTFTPVS